MEKSIPTAAGGATQPTSESSAATAVAAAAAAAAAATDSGDFIFVTGRGGNLVVAVSKSHRGETRWRTRVETNKLPGHENALVPHPPTNTLVVGAGSYLCSLDAATGRHAWCASELWGWGTASPTVALDCSALATTQRLESWYPSASAGAADEENGADRTLRDTVFWASNFQVRGIRLSDGEDRWSFEKPGLGEVPTMLIEDGTLYVGGLGILYALDALTGKHLWSVSPGVAGQLILATMRSSPLYRPRNYDPSSPAQDLEAPSQEKTSAKETKASTSAAANSNSPLYAGNHSKIQLADCESGSKAPPIDLKCFSWRQGQCTGIIPLPSRKWILAHYGATLTLYSRETGTNVWQKKLKVFEYPVTVVVGPGAPPTPISPHAAEPDSDRPPPYTQKAPPTPSSSALSSTTLQASPTDPAVPVGYRIYVHVSTALWCVHAATGSIVWMRKLSVWEDPGYPFLLADAATERLYVAGSRAVMSYDARNGTRIWKTGVFSNVICLATNELGNGETNRSSSIGIKELTAHSS
ncbi:hypothetical protein DFJ73DRAFT_837356, partial [Zopfochytrium polystomum]